LKTKLDLVVIDDSEEVARKRAQQFYIGIPEQNLEQRICNIWNSRKCVKTNRIA
jgi:hypothetical protein